MRRGRHVQLRGLLCVHHRRDGDTKVRHRTPEICGKSWHISNNSFVVCTRDRSQPKMLWFPFTGVCDTSGLRPLGSDNFAIHAPFLPNRRPSHLIAAPYSYNCFHDHFSDQVFPFSFAPPKSQLLCRRGRPSGIPKVTCPMTATEMLSTRKRVTYVWSRCNRCTCWSESSH